MSLWRDFWADEQGALVSAELVAIGTVAVIGTTVGLSTLSKSLDAEMKEVAYSIRSLDQSYSVPGHKSCGAWTAGSSYTQPDVNLSIQELIGAEAGATKAATAPKSDEPVKKRKKNQEKKPQEKKIEKKRDNDDQEQSVLPQSDETNAAVEEVDDQSKVETVIEPVTDA